MLLRSGAFGVVLVCVCGWAVAEDCAPLQAIAGYEGGAPERRDYAMLEFNAGHEVPGADENGYLKLGGRTCKLAYTPAAGQAPRTDADIQAQYRAQFARLGAQVTRAGDTDTVAHAAKDGKDLWFVVDSQQTQVDVTVLEIQAPKYVLTAPSGHDHRLIGHMPNYVARDPEIADGKIDFHVDTDDGGRDLPVAGRVTRLTYLLKDGAQPNSDIEIQTNYRQRLRELGAQFFSSGDDARTTARLEDQGATLWMTVYSQPGEIDVSVVEEKPVAAAAATPAPAPALRTALAKDGHVALYVHFDFNKVTLKPDAKPVLDQVLALLREDAALKLEIDGHTDNIGTRSANATLSRERAAAVVKALTAAGIAADRLSSNGYGAEQPLADNGTAEGRAKNRRVELVKK